MLAVEAPTKTPTKVHPAIAEGVALLEEHYPGWVDEIDLGNFSIFSPIRCVLGQLYGSYSAGSYALGIRVGGGAHYGFVPAGNAELLENGWARYISGEKSQ